MSKKIYITQEQFDRLKIEEGKKSISSKNVIINESQLDIIREYENNKVLHYEFEAKVRKYMEELKNNPCKPKYDDFFVNNNIPEDVLQNRMLDLALIKKSEKISEPEDASGNKHSVHSKRFIFSSKDFDNKIDKLYNSFFKKGERLNETDCGGVGGTSGGFDVDGVSDGVTNAAGVGELGSGQYVSPFGAVQRRKIAGQEKADGVMSQQSNIDMKPTMDRTPGKVAVSESIEEHKGLSDIADEEYYDIVAEFIDAYNNNENVDSGYENIKGVDLPYKVYEIDGWYSEQGSKNVAVENGLLESAVCVFFQVYELTDKTKEVYDKFVNKNSFTRPNGMIYLTCCSIDGVLDNKELKRALCTLPHEQIHGIQTTKATHNSDDRNYILAKNIRDGNTASANNTDKLIADMFWLFDKKEIDANIHKFIVDYREMKGDKIGAYKTQFNAQLEKMKSMLDKLYKCDEKHVNDCLSKYNLTKSKYLKRCVKLFNYAYSEFRKAKENVEKGLYPYPKSKYKY